MVVAMTFIDVMHLSNLNVGDLMCHCGREKNMEKNHLMG
jgi:hypothetical protein